MPIDLKSILPFLTAKAVAWAEEQSALITQTGKPLNEYWREIAHRVGVIHPERIFIAEFTQFPLPEDSLLREAALATGMLGKNMIGLTLGYGIYVCKGHENLRLMSHEFRHVYQYEQAGSIAGFLPTYLEQIVLSGYDHAPYEIDARAHELS